MAFVWIGSAIIFSLGVILVSIAVIGGSKLDEMESMRDEGYFHDRKK